MKKCAAVILLMLFTVQSFYSATIYIWFQVNRSYITNVFCVNKARPEMKCGGQCYLAKQLQKADENNPPQQLKEWLDISPALLQSPFADTAVPTALIAQLPVSPNLRGQHVAESVFHPPLV